MYSTESWGFTHPGNKKKRWDQPIKKELREIYLRSIVRRRMTRKSLTAKMKYKQDIIKDVSDYKISEKNTFQFSCVVMIVEKDSSKTKNKTVSIKDLKENSQISCTASNNREITESEISQRHLREI